MGSDRLRICPPGDRGHINNGPKTSLAHGRRKQANGVESSDEVHRQNSLPLAGRHLSQAMSPSFALRRNGSIVTDRVDLLPQTVLKLAASLGQFVVLRDVALRSDGFAPGLANAFRDLLCTSQIDVYGNRRAASTKGERNGGSNALACTRHQNETTAMAGRFATSCDVMIAPLICESSVGRRCSMQLPQ
jgi:hypothetical protein